MSTPEALIAAIKDRIAAGHDKEAIKQEAMSAGHTAEVFEAAYASATGTAAMPAVSQSAEPVQLPPFFELFKDSFAYAFRRLSLIGWMFGIGLLSLLVIGAALGVMFVSPIIGGVLAFIAVVGIIALAFIFGLTLQYIVVHDTTDNEVSFRTGFTWARKNFFWAGLWVFLLYTLVVQGASSLLLIPYIVIGPFIFFMMFAYVKEGFKGFSAIFRARELGKGNWKALIFRKGCFWLLASLPMIVLFGFALFYVVANAQAIFMGDFSSLQTDVPLLITLFIVFLLYSAVVNLAALRLNGLLYQHLSAARPVTTDSGTGSDRWKYVVLALIGLIALIMPTGDDSSYDYDYSDEEWGTLEWDMEEFDAEAAKERAQELRLEIE